MSSAGSLMIVSWLQSSQESSRQDDNGQFALLKESLLINGENFLESCSNFPLTYHYSQNYIMWPCLIQSQAKAMESLWLAGATFQHWVWRAHPLKLRDMEEGSHLNNSRVLFQRRKGEWLLGSTTRISNKCKSYLIHLFFIHLTNISWVPTKCHTLF